MPSDECHRILLMISQDWFRYWLGAVRQEAITWANVDSVPCRLMASLGHNELTDLPLNKMENIFKCIFMNEKFWILIQVSLKIVYKGLIDKKSALVQVMAWCWTLPEPSLT